jgi:hypothetical protein
MIPARADKIELEHLHFLLSMAFIELNRSIGNHQRWRVLLS